MDLVLIILTSISTDFEKHKQYETHSLHLFQLEIVSTAYITVYFWGIFMVWGMQINNNNNNINTLSA